MSDPAGKILRETFGDLPRQMQEEALELFAQYGEAKRRFDEVQENLAAFGEKIKAYRTNSTASYEAQISRNVVDFLQVLTDKQK